MRAAATEAALLELPVLERRLGTLAALATLVPLVALAGSALAALDLVTALRAAAHHFLAGRVRAIAIEMETAAWSLITFVRHELPEEQAAERKRQA